MKVDLSLPVAGTVFASDAQGAGETPGDHGGYGVVVTTVDDEVAEQVFLGWRHSASHSSLLGWRRGKDQAPGAKVATQLPTHSCAKGFLGVSKVAGP